MAINVELKNEEKTVEKIDFPVLMYAFDYDQIVLFTSERCGTSLKTGNGYGKDGVHHDNFVPCTDKSVWEKYEGEITLKNK